MPEVNCSALPPLRLSQTDRSGCSPFLPAGATVKATFAPSGEIAGLSGTRRSAISSGVSGPIDSDVASDMKRQAPSEASREDRRRTMCDDSTVYLRTVVRENDLDTPRWQRRTLGEC